MDLSRKTKEGQIGISFGVSGVEGCHLEMVGTCSPPATLRSLDVC